MEPRIQTLLSEDRPSDDPLLPPPPPLLLLDKPLPVEPSAIGDESRSRDRGKRRNEDAAENRLRPAAANTTLPPVLLPHLPRSKSSVPIAEVLNNDSPAVPQDRLASWASVNQPPPFSGRLSDILLDNSTATPAPQKRRKVDTLSTGNEKDALTLPRLPVPKKQNKRPRIPPLLQGLHQPPPLPPQERLFPPITEQGAGFGSVRLGGSNSIVQAQEKEKNKSAVQDKEAIPEISQSRPDIRSREQEQGREKERSNPSPTRSNEKEKAKRNKWTPEETKDLMQGVSRFGIGAWKLILKCPDYKFNDRTAVDLKDRFRTCCGDPAKKPRGKFYAARRGKEEKEAAKQSEAEKDAGDSQESQSSGSKGGRKPRSNTDRLTKEELQEMGINAPFEKSRRRDRRQFTEIDDQNLLKGYERHGTVWHKIRADEDLGFLERHPTDLRDRFRIRFPEKYAEAGYKLKPKDAKKQQEKTDSFENTFSSSFNGSSQGSKTNERLDTSLPGPSSWSSAPTVPALSSSGRPRPSNPPLRLPLFPNISPGFEEPTNLQEEDARANWSPTSPVMLSREIMDWVDSRVDATSAQTANPLPGLHSQSLDAMNFSLLTDVSASDTPLENSLLRLPAIPSSSIPSSYPSMLSANSAMSINPAPPTASANPSATVTVESMMMTQAQLQAESSNQNQHAAVQPPLGPSLPTSVPKRQIQVQSRFAPDTPNLPTIIIPHVPAASAKNALHNLPPPADLLSGMPHERRLQGIGDRVPRDDPGPSHVEESSRIGGATQGDVRGETRSKARIGEKEKRVWE